MGEKPDQTGLSGLRYVGVGITFGVYVALGGYAGVWAESRFGWGPWVRPAGILLGVALGIWDLVRTAQSLERQEKGR